MRKFVIAATVCLWVLHAQEPVIRGGVTLVDLLVTVRDKKGALLSTLTQDQFRLFEDGKQQEIRNFARQTELPLTIGMLIDVSGSVAEQVTEERRAARQFFSKILGPLDQAFVIGFARRATLHQDATNSLQKLDEGLNELGTVRVGARGPDLAMAQFPGGPRFPIPGPGRGRGPGRGPSTLQIGGTVLYDAVFLAADEVLQPLSGRKAIILITDGVDQGSRMTAPAALRAAQRSDVIIYSIQIPKKMGGVNQELKRLSEDTGGRVFKFERNLDKVFSAINEELRSQYSLSYVPSNDVRDGTFRKLEVKMLSKDHKAQARQGYYASAAKP